MIFTSTRARAEKGVSGDGLTTAVQPAARAAPSLRVIMAEGKFHGVKIALNQSPVKFKKLHICQGIHDA